MGVERRVECWGLVVAVVDVHAWVDTYTSEGQGRKTTYGRMAVVPVWMYPPLDHRGNQVRILPRITEPVLFTDFRCWKLVVTSRRHGRIKRWREVPSDGAG